MTRFLLLLAALASGTLMTGAATAPSIGQASLPSLSSRA